MEPRLLFHQVESTTTSARPVAQCSTGTGASRVKLNGPSRSASEASTTPAFRCPRPSSVRGSATTGYHSYRTPRSSRDVTPPPPHRPSPSSTSPEGIDGELASAATVEPTRVGQRPLGFADLLRHSCDRFADVDRVPAPVAVPGLPSEQVLVVRHDALLSDGHTP